jgi:uncharacterized protein (DUF3820 family)
MIFIFHQVIENIFIQGLKLNHLILESHLQVVLINKHRFSDGQLGYLFDHFILVQHDGLLRLFRYTPDICCT